MDTLGNASPRTARPAVETIDGGCDEAAKAIESDFALLARCETGGLAAAHAWSCEHAAVVLGVSLDAEREVDLDACRLRSVAVLRRASGGGAVVIGSGTLQYAIALPHTIAEVAASIEGAKRYANAVVRRALACAGVVAELGEDVSGDLRLGDRKVAGLALRRRRTATLVHGTLLLEADLDLVATLLRHPEREPVWRRGRSHRDFLANLGRIDDRAFRRALAGNDASA